MNKTLADRINERLVQLNMSQEKLSLEVGLSQTAVSKICLGATKNPRNLDKIAGALGVSEQWLRFGEEANMVTTSKKTVITWDDFTPLSDDEIEVPFLKETCLSAGLGAEIITDYDGKKLRFGKSLFKNRGINPESVVCVTVSGESMEPVFMDGSTIGINMDNKAIKDGSIYAINNDGLLQVKILKRLSGSEVSIESYNPLYPPMHKKITEIEVIGKVFWYSALFN